MYGIFFSITMIVLLFTHAYTWAIIAVVLVIFGIYVFKDSNNNRKRLLILLSAIAVSLIADIVRIHFTGTSSGIREMTNVFNYGISIDHYYLMWENLTLTNQIYDGVIFSNLLIENIGHLPNTA